MATAKNYLITVLVTLTLSLIGVWAAGVTERVEALEAAESQLQRQVTELVAERKFFLQMLNEMREDLRVIRNAIAPLPSGP